MIGKIDTVTATIDSGETTSDELEVWEKGQISALVMPAAFTGATVTFAGSTDGTTFTTLYKDGADYSVTVGTSKWVVLDPTVFYGTPYIKIVSASSEGAERTITVVTRNID